MSSILAETALVRNGFFFHYCHEIHGLMALRIHHPNCPMCLQKNPDYVSCAFCFPVTNLETNSIVLIFESQNEAINYIQNHPHEPWALGDTGYVKKNA